MPAPAWVFFNADSEPLGDPALAVFQCGHAGIQRHGQQDSHVWGTWVMKRVHSSLR